LTQIIAAIRCDSLRSELDRTKSGIEFAANQTSVGIAPTVSCPPFADYQQFAEKSWFTLEIRCKTAVGENATDHPHAPAELIISDLLGIRGRAGRDLEKFAKNRGFGKRPSQVC
jgi:hypothetical protein